MTEHIGFIGGGRITRVMLHGFKNAQRLPTKIVVSDINNEILEKLKREFPQIEIHTENKMAMSQNIVFIAIHPPVIENVLKENRQYLRPETILISLAPKFTIAIISELLGGFNRIVRMIPNALSFINQGFNPIVFSPTINDSEKQELMEIFKILGETPDVREEKLEAYAILTGMGPTYFWFQFAILQELGRSFGLTDEELKNGVSKMLKGAVNLFFDKGLKQEEVLDLIPVHPLKEKEPEIKKIFEDMLVPLYKKLLPK
ncbi:MAG: pyrroline-5-carboxylate reductase family protein [bacterium]